jgi:hypothetical protein
MAIFRRKSPAPPEPAPAAPWVVWDLARLVERIRDAAPALEAKEVEGDLVHARLADGCRDAGIAPPDPAEFSRQVGRLDMESWRRLALAVAALEEAEWWAGLAAMEDRAGVAARLAFGLPGLAREMSPLTVGLVRQSATRAEEFARDLAMYLGVGIAGETDAESRKRLHALDYRRLLAEAEQARAAAQEKMERLRKRQEEADDSRRQRGKW